jgi:DNA polymerase/3'-5' exonuclease PolX
MTTIRYTATLPENFVAQLKEMAKEKAIPSVNFAINEALSEYLKKRKQSQYEALLKEAGQDKAFIDRTIRCSEDFVAVDGEGGERW